MTVDATPRAVEPARPRTEAVRARADGQGTPDDSGEFAGLLSLSVLADESAEPTGDASPVPVGLPSPTDTPPMAPGDMLALLLGLDHGQAPSALTTPAPDGAAPAEVGAAGSPGPRPATQWAAGRGLAGRADAPAPEAVARRRSSASSLPQTGPDKEGADAVAAPAPDSGPSSRPAAADLAALLAGARAEGRGAGRHGAQSNESPTQGQAPALAPTDGLVRVSGAGPDKLTERVGKPMPENWAPASGLGAQDAGQALPVADTPTLQVSDSALADTVSYWVSQGVQNAELTLDGHGPDPIEVTIQLAHGEAQIGFRSDVAETRQVIEGAMAQLRDALAGQGLVLAGVTVGTSSRQDGQPGDSTRRAVSGRVRGVGMTQTDTLQPLARTPGSVGRRLDVFA